MNPVIKRDILSILSEAQEIIEKGEFFKLRELSDHVIHNASIFQDSDSITAAVIIYALSKIKNPEASSSLVTALLKHAGDDLALDRIPEYREEMKNILNKIAELGTEKKMYISEVLELSQIKKAAKIYEHGISLAQVADALGVSRWELMDYIGKTTIPDSFENIADVMEIR